MGILDAPGVTRISIAKTNVLRALYSSYTSARFGSLANRAIMSAPPTVTANGATQRAGNTRQYNWNTYPGLFRQFGGTPINSSSGIRRFKSLEIWTSGGNIGSASDPGAAGDVWRVEAMVDAIAPSFRLGVSTAANPYRFIVNDQYVDLAGKATLSSSGSYEFITLDFSGAGGRAQRKIVVEGMQNGGFDGIYVGPTESVTQTDNAQALNGVIIGDSYAVGSDAAVYGDGVFMRMADYLGIRNFMTSGSGGTGWQTGGNAYNFLQRINNGDAGLNGKPDIVFLMGSYNDRNASSQAAVQTPALSGMRAIRAQFPSALIVVIGAFPGSSGPSAGILQAEAAMAAAYAQFADPFSVYVPVSNDPAGGPLIFGTGNTGTPNSTGNADLYVDSGGVHLNTLGCGVAGQLLAQKVLAAVGSKFGAVPNIII